MIVISGNGYYYNENEASCPMPPLTTAHEFGCMCRALLAFPMQIGRHQILRAPSAPTMQFTVGDKQTVVAIFAILTVGINIPIPAFGKLVSPG